MTNLNRIIGMTQGRLRTKPVIRVKVKHSIDRVIPRHKEEFNSFDAMLSHNPEATRIYRDAIKKSFR